MHGQRTGRSDSGNPEPHLGEARSDAHRRRSVVTVDALTCRIPDGEVETRTGRQEAAPTTDRQGLEKANDHVRRKDLLPADQVLHVRQGK